MPDAAPLLWFAEEGARVVDLAAERKRLGGAYRIACPKCRLPVHERTTRCPHCGVWFAGMAYEFAPRARLAARAWRFARRVALVAVAILAAALLLLWWSDG